MTHLKDGRDVALELYKFDACPYCQRVLRKIAELGLNDVTLHDIRRDPGAQSELERRGGKGQVPCLIVDGHAMYESLDIIHWLEENVARN